MRIRLRFRRAPRVRATAVTRRATGVLASLAVAIAPLPASANPTFAVKAIAAPGEQPALWVLRDADTTIYLFGTFHALDERTDWFASNIRAAFDSADQLVLETLVPASPAQMFQSLSRHSLMPRPVDGQSVTGSFAASAAHAMAVGRSAGLTVEGGADAVLRRTAERQGKPVGGLESFDFQLAMVAALPAARPAVAVVDAPQSDTRQLLLDMRSAWRRGDGSSFAAVLGSLEAQSPATYQRLFVDRNHRWAQWIAQRMQRPGTVFVAVGTGHLIGRDSVQQQLASRGIRATRIN